MNKTKFALWVDAQGGSVSVSKRLGVTFHNVRAWYRGDYWPTMKMGRKLLKLAKGKLTPKDIFEIAGGPL